MPASDTFDCKPIGELVRRYLAQSKISVDPFARNKQWATYTNDLNPDTAAEYHMMADEFLAGLIDKQVKADLIIFDPPYSLRQARECYVSFGAKEFKQKDSQNAGHWSVEKRLCDKILAPGGIFLHFGWHSNGLGKKRNAEIIEMLLVAHGRAHNDTICTVERKES